MGRTQDIEKAKRIVQGCKDRLKTETNQKVRHALAVIGNEYNDFLLNTDTNPLKKCVRCKVDKPRSEFGFVSNTVYYKRKTDGKISIYKNIGKRNVCTPCLRKQQNPRKATQNEGSFVVGGLRIY